MEITLISVQLDTFDIDFQKLFDFIKNECELENTVWDYSTEFGDNVHYYLEKVFGIKISTKDDCDITIEDGRIYPTDLNEFEFYSLYESYRDWLNKNKEKLGLTEE